jgi:hypothetical protein
MSDQETGAEQMASDLLEVAKVSLDDVDAIATALESEIGFLNAGRLRELLAERIADEEQLDAIVRILTNLRVESVQPALEFLRKRRGDKANVPLVEDSALQDVEAKLPKLVRDYPALRRYLKAGILKTATGNLAQSIHLICDLRPVFDENRERIEGLVPLTILRLSYIQQDGQAREIEVNLPRQSLAILEAELKKAQTKIAVLSQEVGSWIANGYVDPS